jgi:hypothetical protein
MLNRSLFQASKSLDHLNNREPSHQKLYEFADSRKAAPGVYLHGAFLVAMQSCEYCKTPTPSRTKITTLPGILFRSKSKHKIPQDIPYLSSGAEFVTITLVNQKIGTQMDLRTQQKPETKSSAPSSNGPWQSSKYSLQSLMPPALPVCSLFIYNNFISCSLSVPTMAVVLAPLSLATNCLLGRCHGTIPNESFCCQNHDPWMVVFPCVLGLHPPPAARMD